MGRATKYNSDWEKTYPWLQKDSTNHTRGICKICNVPFRIDGSGILQVKSHANSQKHARQEEILTGNTTQATFTKNTFGESVLNRGRGNYVPTDADKVVIAEILWAMKCAVQNYSFSSNKQMPNLFKKMFPDSKIADSYATSETKCKYLIQFAIAEWVKEKLIEDSSSTPYTFKFDETTTKQVKKQYDAYLQYWSKEHDRVINAYVGSLFVGHCTSQHLTEHFFKFGKEFTLSYEFLIHIGMDGPNFNLAFQRELEEKLKVDYDTSILKLGTCSLHPVHTSFMKGLSKLDFDFNSLAQDLHFFFKLSSTRREDYITMEEITSDCAEFLLKHVQSRWLSLKKVLIRILGQWNNLDEYFLKYLPKQKTFKNDLQSTHRYKHITSVLKDPRSKIFIGFAIYIAEMLESFLIVFQSEEPLIHILYPSFGKLLFNILSPVIAKKILCNDNSKCKDAYELSKIDITNFENQIPLSKIDIGIRAKTALIQARLPPNDEKEIRIQMRTCYIEMASYLFKKLPLDSIFLKDVQFIHPDMRMEPRSKFAISRLSTAMTSTFKGQLEKVFSTNDEVDSESISDLINNQWCHHQTEDIDPSLYEDTETGKNIRIDEYWKKINNLKDVTGKYKYPQLYALVKACCCISHGNATPERGFSLNKSLIENRTSLAEETITAIRLVKDYVYTVNGVLNVVINKRLIDLAKDAHKRYNIFMEKKRQDEKDRIERELKIKRDSLAADKDNENKRKIIEDSEKIVNKIQEEKLKLSIANELIADGNKKLKDALYKTKHMHKDEVLRAEAMISMGLAGVAEMNQTIQKLESEKTTLDIKIKRVKK